MPKADPVWLFETKPKRAGIQIRTPALFVYGPDIEFEIEGRLKWVIA
jgi:hypothetical protein